jgi:hypothetical protein
MSTVYVLNSDQSILFSANVQEDHFVLMVRRGWITLVSWLIESGEVPVISYQKFIDYINEAA